MKPMKNPYEVLGVEKTADRKEIKRSYLSLSGKYHPDKCEKTLDNKLKFQEIQDAYDILKDPTRRREFDETGEISPKANEISHLAEQLLAHFLSLVLDNAPVGRTLNLVTEVELKLSRKLQEDQRQKKNAEKALDTLQRYSQKVKNSEGGYNLFQGVIEDKLRRVQQRQRSMEQSLKVLAEAEAILNGYENEEALLEGAKSPSWGPSLAWSAAHTTTSS